jgi:hypothetical protein
VRAADVNARATSVEGPSARIVYYIQCGNQKSCPLILDPLFDASPLIFHPLRTIESRMPPARLILYIGELGVAPSQAKRKANANLVRCSGPNGPDTVRTNTEQFTRVVARPASLWHQRQPSEMEQPELRTSVEIAETFAVQWL